MKEFTLKDTDIFDAPEFTDPNLYDKRTTVKAIVRNDGGLYAFVTNPVHNCVLLAGGGAESDNLLEETVRECAEELQCEVNIVNQIAVAHEYRNRNATQYYTVCSEAELVQAIAEDARTDEEKDNDLQVIWLSKEDATQVLAKQVKQVEAGEIAFYNTAFNVIRDQKFWQTYVDQKSTYDID